MRVISIYIFVLAYALLISSGFSHNFDSERLTSQANFESSDKPLILTPYLEKNQTDEARRLSEVRINGFDTVKSYSGYFTVNHPFNSNHFFWFFPAENNVTHAPVLLWLQGGPGDTSLIGLFEENGPFHLLNETHMELREERWTKNHSIIYIDNPVGTGYSFTDFGYCVNSLEIGQELYNSLQQFFQLFPDLRKNEFYIAGESYAGKYILALAHTVHQTNIEAILKINLKGLMIGNGLVDPINQLNHDEYLNEIGLIDSINKCRIRRRANVIIDKIKSGKFIRAFQLLRGLFSHFMRISGYRHLYNIREPHPTFHVSRNYLSHFVQSNSVRNAIHVSNQSFNDGLLVETILKHDIMRSVAAWLSEALDHYKVLIYNGQLDIIIAYTTTLNYLRKLDFSEAAEYKNATRQIWYVGDDLAGYVKEAGNLKEVLVRNAGHMVPYDQPKWARDLITRFTHHQSFNRN